MVFAADWNKKNEFSVITCWRYVNVLKAMWMELVLIAKILSFAYVMLELQFIATIMQ